MGGWNDAGIMKDTGAGTLQAGAVWNLPSPSTSNVWRICDNSFGRSG